MSFWGHSQGKNLNTKNQKIKRNHELKFPSKYLPHHNKNTSTIQSCDHFHQCELTISCCKLQQINI